MSEELSEMLDAYKAKVDQLIEHVQADRDHLLTVVQTVLANMQRSDVSAAEQHPLLIEFMESELARRDAAKERFRALRKGGKADGE